MTAPLSKVVPVTKRFLPLTSAPVIAGREAHVAPLRRIKMSPGRSLRWPHRVGHRGSNPPPVTRRLASRRAPLMDNDAPVKDPQEPSDTTAAISKRLDYIR